MKKTNDSKSSYMEILNKRVEKGMRINKFIADSGFCSRRQADTLIAQNKVLLNEETATLGSRVFPDDRIQINDKILIVPHEYINIHDKIYLAYNKPKGIVCTCDYREKNNIIDAINYHTRIFPIGRLDKFSHGLILLTNDGDIVNRLLRAENRHEKEYLVELDKAINNEDLNILAKGVPILDTVTLPCKIKRIAPNKFKIILVQGLNRQIRRMCEYLGYQVKDLCRLRIMNINLAKLALGEYRELSHKELAQLESLLN